MTSRVTRPKLSASNVDVLLMCSYLIRMLMSQLSNFKRRVRRPVLAARAHSLTHTHTHKQPTRSYNDTAEPPLAFTCCFSKCSRSAPRLASTRRLFTRVGTCLMLFILPVCWRRFRQNEANKRMRIKLLTHGRIAKGVFCRAEAGVWV